MKIFTYLAFAFAATALANTERRGHHTHKRQNQLGPDELLIVKGAAGAGPPIPRLDIVAMQQDHPDLFNLFLLAMYRWKKQDPTKPNSYYRVAGIHGHPFVEYNDKSPRCHNCTSKAGYCHHETPSFPNWHSPLMCLYDQVLREFAFLAASEFKGADLEKYTAAAKQMLMPFWAWYKPMRPGEQPLPALYTDDTAHVNTPVGPMYILNPLKLFNFTAAGVPHDWISDPAAGTTIRKPQRITAKWRQNVQTLMWSALSAKQPFNEFSCKSTKGYSTKHPNPHSLESLHDQAHGGISGDMNVLSKSSFDPIFANHHGTTGLCLDVYLKAYPDNFLEPHLVTGDSFSYAKGQKMDADSPLYPFLKDENNFWTPNDMRDPRVCGYYHPEAQTQEQAIAFINSLYRAGTGHKRSLISPLTDPSPWLKNLSTDIEDLVGNILEPYSSVTNGQTISEYTVVITVNAHIEEGSFIVFLFDGTPDHDTTNWASQDEILLGWNNFFTSQTSMEGDPSTGAVSITDALLDRVRTGQLTGMDEATVKRYLHDRMQIRVVRDATDQEVPAKELSEFQVVLQHNHVTLPTSLDALATWHDPLSLHLFIV